MACGGRLLDFTGPQFQNAETNGYLDVPRAVISRWTEIAVAERQIQDLKQMKLAIASRAEPIGGGGKAYVAVMDARKRELERITSSIKEIQVAGKLIGSMDDKFSQYWDNYYWRKGLALQDTEVILMPSGERFTSYDLLVNELRSVMKKAIARIRGEC